MSKDVAKGEARWARPTPEKKRKILNLITKQQLNIRIEKPHTLELITIHKSQKFRGNKVCLIKKALLEKK
jgi:hypothetical protein